MNIHSSMLPDMVKPALFEAIHDIVPTNDRLAAIRLKNTSSCARCGEPDSIQHKITECMEGRLIWIWTLAKRTTQLDDRTCLPVLVPAKAGGALMDHCPPSLLPLTVQ